MKDLSNNINPAVSIINAVKTAAGNGTGVDLQGYESATVLVDVGAEGDSGLRRVAAQAPGRQRERGDHDE